MTSKDRKANETIRQINKAIDKEEKTKKENNKVKKFFKSTKFTVALTVILTALSIYGGYRLYDFVYTQGYQDAVSEREAIAKQVAELSKTKQQ